MQRMLGTPWIGDEGRLGSSVWVRDQYKQNGTPCGVPLNLSINIFVLNLTPAIGVA